jgi:hypothetical protein
MKYGKIFIIKTIVPTYSDFSVKQTKTHPGWARNISGDYKKEKERLLNIIDSLDIKAETPPLSDSERSLKKESDERLANLRRDEESKWAQRAKVKHIQEGGQTLNISISLQMANIERKKISN